MSTTPLVQFLANTKRRYLEDIRSAAARGSEWTVVMGNESGDLDSVASSIAYAYVSSAYGQTQSIPLLQMDRADFSLRAENLYALSQAGITDPDSQLLFISDVLVGAEAEKSAPFPSRKFVLVDHNRLGARYAMGNPSAVVTAIIDHHADENEHLSADPRIVRPAGSCASHITRLLFQSSGNGGVPVVPGDLATLLLGAILIDTNGLKPKGKGLPVDYSAALFLFPRSSLYSAGLDDLILSCPDGTLTAEQQGQVHDIPALRNLATTLGFKKADLSHLKAYDILRRDYKEYTYDIPSSPSPSPSPSPLSKVRTINVGLSTVPLPLQANWTLNNQLLESSMEWMTNRQLSILGILTTFVDDKKGKNGKGKHKRETVWFVAGGSSSSPSVPDADSNSVDAGLDLDGLSNRLFTGLEACEELRLEEYKGFRVEIGDQQGLRVKVYKQKNADATRKAIAPLLKKILETQG
ncbi:hypothetical protein AX17_007066 [Amanita inopinata Kibby_2008]|nr:hypothetical protein AX17_007066 [Amanita inopinata Kibby_2008]